MKQPRNALAKGRLKRSHPSHPNVHSREGGLYLAFDVSVLWTHSLGVCSWCAHVPVPMFLCACPGVRMSWGAHVPGLTTACQTPEFRIFGPSPRPPRLYVRIHGHVPILLLGLYCDPAQMPLFPYMPTLSSSICLCMVDRAPQKRS